MKFQFEPRLHEIVECARVCHAAHRAYCYAIGDSSHAKWENASEDVHRNFISGVQAHVDSGLTLTPKAAHEAWCESKKKDGWKHGHEKDVNRKRHPCLRPYHELPSEQQVKDAIFRSIVHAVFARHMALEGA